MSNKPVSHDVFQVGDLNLSPRGVKSEPKELTPVKVEPSQQHLSVDSGDHFHPKIETESELDSCDKFSSNIKTGLDYGAQFGSNIHKMEPADHTACEIHETQMQNHATDCSSETELKIETGDSEVGWALHGDTKVKTEPAAGSVGHPSSSTSTDSFIPQDEARSGPVPVNLIPAPGSRGLLRIHIEDPLNPVQSGIVKDEPTEEEMEGNPCGFDIVTDKQDVYMSPPGNDADQSLGKRDVFEGLDAMNSSSTRGQDELSTLSGGRPFTCDQCDKTYVQNGDLVRHKLVHVEEIPFKCDQCDIACKTKSRLRSHKRHIHTGEKPFVCSHCGHACRLKSELLGHQSIHSTEKAFKCDRCDKAFVYWNELTRHAALHAGETTFKCDFCYEIFPNENDLTEHKHVHTGEKPFACNQCGKTFKRKFGLIIHQRKVHTKDKPFACDQCDKTFTFPSELAHHKHFHSGVKPYVCHQCDKKFTTSACLSSHKRWHSSERPFACEYCDKAFLVRHKLIEHQRIHTGERPFKCDQCDKAYMRNFHLTLHKRTHSGEKRYQCDECDKAFTTGQALNYHKHAHTGGHEKPFACDQCDKAFATKRYLGVHQRIHTGEKPFRCDQCDVLFRHITALTRHQQLTCTGRGQQHAFKCDLCEEVFKSKLELTDHEATHAGEIWL